MIIDSHIHLWNRVAGRLGRTRVQPLKNGLFLVGKRKIQGMPSWFLDCRNLAELALAAFDDAGVDVGIVTQEYLDGNQNRYLARIIRKFPGRFFTHALLEFTRPEGLAREFRLVLKRGFRGIKCPAMYLPQQKVPLDHPKLMEIWAEMSARGMVLSIDLAPGEIQVPEMQKVLQKFPYLKVAVGHCGMVGHGNWLAQISLAEFPNVYIDCGGIVWLFRQEGPPFRNAQKKIQEVVKRVGPDKIMWGSDYPRTMVDFTYRQSLEFAVSGCRFLSEKERSGFLGGNAARLYSLPVFTRKRPPHIRITEV